MVLNIHRNHKAKSLGTGRRGVWGWGEREVIYLSVHRHYPNDSRIKMGNRPYKKTWPHYNRSDSGAEAEVYVSIKPKLCSGLGVQFKECYLH